VHGIAKKWVFNFGFDVELGDLCDLLPNYNEIENTLMYVSAKSTQTNIRFVVIYDFQSAQSEKTTTRTE
jgi:hypothetical protein